MTDDEAVDLLVELFHWDIADQHDRYAALRILKNARDEPCPTYDDYKAGRVR